jgi:hypothetical protein
MKIPRKYHKNRFYYIYTVYLFDKKINKKTAILIQNTTDIYNISKWKRLFYKRIISNRLKSMIEYQLGYNEFDILRWSVEKVDVG